MKLLQLILGWLDGSKTLDTEAAAKICRNLSILHPKITVYAGILGDFNMTCDIIFKDGAVVHGAKPHISSTWGTPCLFIEEMNQYIPCWKYGYRNWND